MHLPEHDQQRELAALAAQRAAQRVMDAHHRAQRLATALRQEETILARTDHVLTSVGALLRRIIGNEPVQYAPIALVQPGHDHDERRDAA